MKRPIWLVLLGIFALLASGCLSVEKKIYYFKLAPDGTGEGKVVFVNIVSQEEDGQDVSLADFQALLDDYIDGTTFEEQNLNLKVLEKRLYEEDGKLCGEVKFRFDSPEKAGFLREKSCECAPYYYFFGSLGEELVETNGQNLEKETGISVIKWSPETKEFTFTTRILEKENLENTHSLVDLYREWKKK